MMTGSGQQPKNLSFRHPEGECLWEWMCPLVLLKKKTQIREWWARCAWPQIGELPLERRRIPQGGDRGKYSGHGNHTKNRGDLYTNS